MIEIPFVSGSTTHYAENIQKDFKNSDVEKMPSMFISKFRSLMILQQKTKEIRHKILHQVGQFKSANYQSIKMPNTFHQ